MARKQVFTTNNILTGWFGSKMWPVNRAKPLISRSILVKTLAVIPTTPKKAEKTTNLNSITPSNRHQLKRLLNDFITPESGAYNGQLAQRNI